MCFFDQTRNPHLTIVQGSPQLKALQTPTKSYKLDTSLPQPRNEMAPITHHPQTHNNQILALRGREIRHPWLEPTHGGRAIVAIVERDPDPVLGHGTQHFLREGGDEGPGDGGEGLSNLP